MKDADEINEEDAAAIAEITQNPQRHPHQIPQQASRPPPANETGRAPSLYDKRDYSQLTDGQLDTLDELETLARARSIWRPDPDAHRLQRKDSDQTAPYPSTVPQTKQPAFTQRLKSGPNPNAQR